MKPSLAERFRDSFKGEMQFDSFRLLFFLPPFVLAAVAFAVTKNVAWLLLALVADTCMDRWRHGAKSFWIVTSGLAYLGFLVFMPWQDVWTFFGYWRT